MSICYRIKQIYITIKIIKGTNKSGTRRSIPGLIKGQNKQREVDYNGKQQCKLSCLVLSKCHVDCIILIHINILICLENKHIKVYILIYKTSKI
jgi:hypothetical protein